MELKIRFFHDVHFANKKTSQKMLQSAPRTDRNKTTEKIVQLGTNPDNPGLDIKKLQGEPYFRLRVGSWRIIFDRTDEVKIISIEKIKSRGDVYK